LGRKQPGVIAHIHEGIANRRKNFIDGLVHLRKNKLS